MSNNDLFTNRPKAPLLYTSESYVGRTSKWKFDSNFSVSYNPLYPSIDISIGRNALTGSVNSDFLTILDRQYVTHTASVDLTAEILLTSSYGFLFESDSTTHKIIADRTLISTVTDMTDTLSVLQPLVNSYISSTLLPNVSVAAATLTTSTLAVVNTIPPNVDRQIFGDGSDGDVTIEGTTVTLYRDAYYNSLTIRGSGRLLTNAFRVFVRDTLDLTAASVGAFLTLTTSSMTLGCGGIGEINGNSVTASSGSVGVVPTNPTTWFGGGEGGNGGAGGDTLIDIGYVGEFLTSQIGGSGATAPDLSSFTRSIAKPVQDLICVESFIHGGGGGAGGGSGAHDSGSLGSQNGGRGGNGAGVVYIAANKLLTSTTTPEGVIWAVGRDGDDVVDNISSEYAGGSGGGGGGGGGFVYLIINEKIGPTVTNGIKNEGGWGGDGGTTQWPNEPGFGGQGGSAGRSVVINLSQNTVVATTGSARGSIPTDRWGSQGGSANVDL